MPRVYELNYILDSDLRQTLLTQMDSQPFCPTYCQHDGHLHPFQVVSTRAGTLVLTPEIDQVRENVTNMLEAPEGITIIKTPPNTEMGVHTDAAKNAHRKTLLIILLSSPDGENNALRFYDEGQNILEQHSYDNNKAILTITDQRHQAVNYTDAPRYSLQFGFSKSIDELIEIYES